MSFSSLQSSAATKIVATLGQPVTYQTRTGATASINAVIGQQVDPYGGAGQVGEHRWQATVTVADAPHIARDELLVTASGVGWRIEDILEEDGYVTTVSIARV